MNFEKLDKNRKFAFRDEKLAIAREHGYNYITEAIADLYTTKGRNKTAEIMEMCTENVVHVVKYMGLEVNKLKRGGRINQKLTPDQVAKARRLWDGVSVGRNDIEAIKVAIGADVSNNALRNALRGITWGDV